MKISIAFVALVLPFKDHQSYKGRVMAILISYMSVGVCVYLRRKLQVLLDGGSTNGAWPPRHIKDSLI